MSNKRMKISVDVDVYATFKEKCKSKGVPMVSVINHLMVSFNDGVKIKKIKESKLKELDDARLAEELEYVIAKEEAKKSAKLAMDKPMIDDIIRIINTLKKDKNTQPVKRAIMYMAKIEEGLGEVLVGRLLVEYDGIYWGSKPYRHGGGGRPTKKYKNIRN